MASDRPKIMMISPSVCASGAKRAIVDIGKRGAGRTAG
jgi:hypothetical protein